ETTIANPKGELKVGMVASLELATGTGGAQGPVAVLPLGAIVRARPGEDAFAVYIVDEHGIARRRAVRLGDFLGNMVPIKSGLADSDRVIVMGASLVADGEPVEIIP